MPGSPQWSFSLRFPHQNLIHTSPLPHSRYMPRLSHSSRLYHPHNIWWGVPIIKILIMKFMKSVNVDHRNNRCDILLSIQNKQMHCVGRT
jgi:hypothetical protein